MALPTQFEQLASAAFADWGVGDRVSYQPLQAGLSGACVVKVDIRGAGGGIPSGQYVLKLSERPKYAHQDDEITAHRRAADRATEFAARHIPQLVRAFDPGGGSGYAMLYAIAGQSLDSYTATDMSECPGFPAVCDRVTTDLLSRWVDPEPTTDLRPHELLEHWLGYRLDPTQAPAVHTYAGSRLATEYFDVVGGKIVLNPLTFCSFVRERNLTPRGVLHGLLHGDLHGGNLLIHRQSPGNKDYWLIDFGLSKVGPAGFDQAYIEFAHILYCLGERDPVQLVQVLKAVDDPEVEHLLPPGTSWLARVLIKLRKATADWVDKRHTPYGRGDDVSRQFLLARVAAGVNWANKKTLPDNARHLALCYAGWAAHAYFDLEPELADEYWRQNKRPAAPLVSAVNVQLWQQLWSAVKGFSPDAGRFVLVAEALNDDPDLRVLGQLPWSAVIDLDPDSDQMGLFRHAAPLLETKRGLHTFSTDLGRADIARSTAWMMAAGWSLKNEPTTDYQTWKYDKLPAVRTFVRELNKQCSPEPIHVLIVPGQGHDASLPLARLEEIAAAFEEGTRGRAVLWVLGPRPLSGRVEATHVPLDLGFWIEQLVQSFGRGGAVTVPQVPGPERQMRAVPLDELRTMEENFDLLHSAILGDTTGESREAAESGFWRGRPPTWADLHAGIDVPRAIHKALVAALRARLDEYRTSTVVLYHAPGAGGTTAALRAAWELHLDHPTAVLRVWSEALPNRLHDLYRRAESPILLVADASTLTESNREDLHRELLQRNVPVVLLYLRRVIQEKTDDLFLPDPMEADEAKLFLHRYSTLTADAARTGELKKITHAEDLKRYRSPFFYGLITFERDFHGTTDYVNNHLRGVRLRLLEVMQYLALVTIYTNSGLHGVVIRRMLRLSDQFPGEMAEWFGDGPARLTSVHQGRYRLMHQVIAEEVLKKTQGADWHRDLHSLAIDFITTLQTHGGAESNAIIDLLRQMFVDRQGRGLDGVDDREYFAPLVEQVDRVNREHGHRILETLTQQFPGEPHFWNHLGRHQIYRIPRDEHKAEDYLLKAISLANNDHLHYHTLGQVRRKRLQRLIGKYLTDRRGAAADVPDFLANIAPLFAGAAEAFQQARDHRRDDLHGYITHVQMILEVTRHLKGLVGVPSITHLADAADEWVQENLSLASSLLDDAIDLYGTLEQPDDYLTGCFTELEKLYGNVDEVIRLWELAHQRRGGSMQSRRALAYAYLDRRERSWSALEEAELRRIVELMEENLRSVGRREDDYKLWFEAYKLLPGFDAGAALSRLKLWKDRFPSWRAHYYTYVVHFLLWFFERSDAIDEMIEELEACEKAAYGRKSKMHNWLGRNGDCPLLATADLGERDKATDFWEHTGGLRRVNGVIEKILGPQSGYIMIDGKVKAFFVPGRGDLLAAEDGRPGPTREFFSADKDENKPVNFHLGFSPKGPRAWNVARGHVPEGYRTPPDPAAPRVAAPLPPATEEAKQDRLKHLKKARVLQFISDVVAMKELQGGTLTVAELERTCAAVFGADDLMQVVKIDDLAKALEKGPGDGNEYVLTDKRGEVVVRRRGAAAPPPEPTSTPRRFGAITYYDRMKRWGRIKDGDRKEYYFTANAVAVSDRADLDKNCFVEFTPCQNTDGWVAENIRLPHGDELVELADKTVTEFLDTAAGGGSVDIPLAELTEHLTRRFGPERATNDLLQVTAWKYFVVDSPDVTLTGNEPNVRVIRAPVPAFGRISPPPARKPLPPKPGAKKPAPPTKPAGPKPAKKPGKTPAPKPARDASRKQLLAVTRDVVSSGSGKVPIDKLEAKVRTRMTVATLKQALDGKTFAEFILASPAFITSGRLPKLHVMVNPNPNGVQTVTPPPPPPPPPAAPKEPTATPPPAPLDPAVLEFRAAVAERVRQVAREAAAAGTELHTGMLGALLNSEFPGEVKLKTRLKKKTLADFLRSLGDFDVSGEMPNFTVRLKQS